MSRQGRKGRTIAAAVAVAALGAFASGGPLDELMPRPRSIVPKDGVVMHGVPVKVERKAVECANPLTADEAYRLVISTDAITITAAGSKGERAARATLEQLKKLSDGRLPCCEITDAPAYRWRGFMHDCGRNFLDKAEILKLLDLMAAYKFNLFHWHITDYYGWRLESKKYPMLQAPWSFRRQMNRYYTQEDFKEVVAYAKARGITVMPELDVPGHTLAFRRGLGITHMSEPQVKGIVADLLDELCSLVPAEDMPFVHLGTDEARTPYEMVPDSCCPHWAETIRRNGRIPVAWTPGKQFLLPDGSRPARMVWNDGYKAEKDELIFDTVRGYFGSKDPLTFLNTAVFSKPMRYDIPAENMLGAVICSWHDDFLGEDTSRIWTNCSFASAIVAYSDSLWNGREKDRPEYLVKLPAPGTPAFAEATAFENAIVANRDKVVRPLGLPFAYVRQTPLRFRITDSEGRVVAKDVAQATVMISDCGRHALDRANSYLMETQGVAYVETWIKSPRNQTVGAWIGFTMFGRSGGRRHGLPEKDEWGRSLGTKVEVNGVAVPAPAWIHPGLKHVMTHPEEPTSDNVAETPFTNEEYFMRPPTEISLKTGWNHVRLTVPKSIGDEWGYFWVSTFVPVTLESHPREVAGLEFSSEPEMCIDR